MSQSTGKSDKPKQKKKVKVFTKKKKQNDSISSTIEKLQDQYDKINPSEITKFSDFPLSPFTQKGLKEFGYNKPTEIQKESIGLALQGKDILGAAQTGSGKTLAFLIPLLEKLFVKKWTRVDGVGALVITPTRELAYQIFEALRKVGQYHDFSAGLIIGGKDLKFERNRMDQCNIMICTPGRLLQHMDENPLFDCVNMQILVLDEADRCLDMGFEQTMNAIIANLPPTRQTLLFSATQTKSVKDLARLSLKDPSYVSVHEHLKYSTPLELKQSYVVCEIKDKISILWSFIKNHPNKKIMVFLASCKQVKYVYEIFCKLRPGSPLLALYGTLHQLRRMDIYENFCQKQSAILFATDLAARGLDFPQVHWVVQVDCPEDPATYIHRVGRTARFHRGGESLLMLLDSELEMVKKLEEKKIPIEKIDINPMKLNNPVRKMEAYLAKNPALKDTAQRAFVSYAKAIFHMKDREVFKVESLDTDSFAHSLGLAIPPRIRFLQRMNSRKEKSNKPGNNKKYFDAEGDEEDCNKPQNNKKYFDVEGDEEDTGEGVSEPFHVADDDDILTIKRQDHDIDMPTEGEMLDLEIQKGKSKKPLTKAALAKKLMKKKIKPNKKILFDEEGQAITSIKDKQSELAQEYEREEEPGINIEKARQVLQEEDKFDKKLFKDKVKAKHKEAKRKLKEKKKQKQEEEVKDDFGESDSEADPDLSWLPDPDNIYGEKSQEELDKLSEEVAGNIEVHRSKQTRKEVKALENGVSDNVKTNRKVKRKSVDPTSTVGKKKKLKDLSSSLSINEAEELALMLISKK